MSGNASAALPGAPQVLVWEVFGFIGSSEGCGLMAQHWYDVVRPRLAALGIPPPTVWAPASLGTFFCLSYVLPTHVKHNARLYVGQDFMLVHSLQVDAVASLPLVSAAEAATGGAASSGAGAGTASASRAAAAVAAAVTAAVEGEDSGEETEAADSSSAAAASKRGRGRSAARKPAAAATPSRRSKAAAAATPAASSASSSSGPRPGSASARRAENAAAAAAARKHPQAGLLEFMTFGRRIALLQERRIAFAVAKATKMNSLSLWITGLFDAGEGVAVPAEIAPKLMDRTAYPYGLAPEAGLSTPGAWTDMPAPASSGAGAGAGAGASANADAGASSSSGAAFASAAPATRLPVGIAARRGASSSFDSDAAATPLASAGGAAALGRPPRSGPVMKQQASGDGSSAGAGPPAESASTLTGGEPLPPASAFSLSFSTCSTDKGAHACWAWRNPVVFLPRTFDLKAGDTVIVDSRSDMTFTPPRYAFRVTVMRAGEAVERADINLDDVYPEFAYIDRRSSGKAGTSH